MTKVFTPKEVMQNKQESIPDFVIDAFNTLLSEKFNGISASFTQNSVVLRIMSLAPLDIEKETIFSKGWLDIEELYEKGGWNVTYDKPGYNETGDATFYFSVKR